MFHVRGSGERAYATSGTSHRLLDREDRIRCAFERGKPFRFQHVHMLERFPGLRRNNTKK